MNYFARAKELAPEMTVIRRQIHQNAETGFDLPNTVSLVMSKLREYGYEPKQICEGGVVATVGPAGKTVLLRADMDALPCRRRVAFRLPASTLSMPIPAGMICIPQLS